MRPFLQFRLWLRQGPVAERSMAAVAAVVVAALVVWAAVPTGSGSSDSVTVGAGGTEAATAGTGGATGATGAVAPGGSTSGQSTSSSTGGGSGTVGTVGGTGTGTTGSVTSGTGTGATSTSGGPTSNCPAGATDVGVTAERILVGVSLPDLGELGRAFNVPSVAVQQRAWDAVFAHYNKQGSVQCRRMVPKYYADNVTDGAAELAACRQMEQDKLYALINNFYFPEAASCPAQAKIPNLWYIPPHNPAIKKYYPYILSYQPDYQRLVRTYVRGAEALGWFKGHGKVGILEASCFPYLNDTIHAVLDAIGITGKQRSTYNYGCVPNAPSQPDKDTSAALQFATDGVTHVMSVAYGRIFSFSSVADSQNFHPKYAVMDDGEIAAGNHSASNGAGRGLDGALGVGVTQIGVTDTPGIPVSPATAECAKIMKAAGFPSPLDPNSASYGSPCDGVRVFAAAAARAPGLTRRSLAIGLSKVGPLDISFPNGPGNYTDPLNPTGGHYWRPLRYEYACNCWKVASAAFRPGFK